MPPAAPRRPRRPPARPACRHVLSDVTGRSLVLVDELGKGTEVRAGAALAGAMLEQLAAVGCKVGDQPPWPTPWPHPMRCLSLQPCAAGAVAHCCVAAHGSLPAPGCYRQRQRIAVQLSRRLRSLLAAGLMGIPSPLPCSPFLPAHRASLPRTCTCCWTWS